jgi:hypothetical protein
MMFNIIASLYLEVVFCWYNRVVRYFQNDKLLILSIQKHCRSIWSLCVCVTKEIVRNNDAKRERKKQTCHQLFSLLFYIYVYKQSKRRNFLICVMHIYIHIYRTKEKINLSILLFLDRDLIHYILLFV